MRIRLDIAYDGTHFRGWARQTSLRTVQGTLEDALALVLGTAYTSAPTPRLVVAGRTDAGVHASGQVAHLDLDAQLLDALGRSRPKYGSPLDLLAQRVRGVLGKYADVTVRNIREAPEGFDARFSAVWRRYQYRIADSTTGYDPLERTRTTNVNARLDEEAMDAAARSLIGLHDFAAYCRPREGATTIRTLLEYDWRRDENGVLIANVRADAFCHSMVRALVGACVAVGRGRLSVEDVATLRDAQERTSAFPVLAARGLTLMEVGYPADDQLSSRADATRARRDDE
ncbi:MAG: tRNA pseudouridine(38-40) synthase TruA [Microbacterium sp.]|uniref:tRNA pseudouridine(38-40) synthase TruA n=1 Tax=Microbacterium sp. TaxID=51671 RepID=UPI00271FABEA|nr:tRNA pseudouridine(38-40) synthase TruA [Microbacterium sp.]MDO8383305.1 tRNA pseudouridine(38-40) synthase TruA [Microbacterium sp.]